MMKRKYLTLSVGMMFLSTPALADDGGQFIFEPECFGSGTCATDVPAPGMLGLFAIGIAGIALRKRRRKNKDSVG
jgi:PEP-CTERM motif